MRHEAIRNLYPEVFVIQDGIGCFDSNNEVVEIDEQLVDLEIQKLYSEYMRFDYARKRRPEYPPLENLADALYWQSKGDDTKMVSYLQACDEVKNKYPKGENDD